MVLLPIIFGSIVLMFVVFGFVFLGILFNKTGLTILSVKMKLRNYGLLWIPMVGSWYEGTIVGKFIGCANVMRIVYVVLNTISVGLLIAMISIDYTNPCQETVRNIAHIFAFVFAIFKSVTRIIGMKKTGFNLAGAICINIFIPHFWSLFMIGKAAEKGLEVN